MKLTHTTKRAKKGMTLLELTVVILVLLSLISILFIGARAWKKGSDKAGCIMNIRNVQQAVRSFQNMNAQFVGTTLDWSSAGELVGPGNFLEVAPKCPSDGSTYSLLTTIPDVGTLVATCGNASYTTIHIPADYTGW